MSKEEARKKVKDFIDKKGYTYSVEDLIHSYLDYYQKGYYVSDTTKDCLLHLEDEFKILTA